MSDATVRLLQTAAEILGGEEALARHLNIGALLMRAYPVQRPTPHPKAAEALEDTVRDLKSRPV